MENAISSKPNRTMPNSFWFKLSTILTAVVLGLLSASVAQAAIIVGESGSWFTLGGTHAWFTLGTSTPAWYALGFPPPSAQGASWGYSIMVVIIPMIIAVAVVLLSLRFIRGRGWVGLLLALTVGLIFQSM